MPATFLWFLFDWRGRVGPRSYRRAILVIATIAGLLEFIPARNPDFLLGLASAQLLVQAALDSKRLHDIGRSAAWIFISGGLCGAAVAGLILPSPELAAALTETMRKSIGPAANSAWVSIVFAAMTLAAALRAAVLATRGSNNAGAAYDYDPRAGRIAATGEGSGSRLDADALIARAMAEQKHKEKAAAGQVAPQSGVRKTFGRRAA